MSRRWTQEGLYEEISAPQPVAGESVSRSRRDRKHMPPAGIRHLGLEGPPPLLVHVLPPDQGGSLVTAPAHVVSHRVSGARECPLQGAAEGIAPPDHDVVTTKRTWGTRWARIPRARDREADNHRPATAHGRMRRAPTQRGIQ